MDPYLDLGLDEVLPYYVDYLARLDQDEDVVNAATAVLELIRSGGGGGEQNQPLAKDAELTLGETAIELRQTTRDRVLRRSYPYVRISEPAAFTSSKPGVAHNKLIVFREHGVGHFQGNDVFHIFQCIESEPHDLVEQIENKLQQLLGSEGYDAIDQASLNGSVRMRQGPPAAAAAAVTAVSSRQRRLSGASSVSTFATGTDSVRSATVRRRPKSTMILYSNGDQQQQLSPGGVATAKPVATPTPPMTPKMREMTLDKTAAKKAGGAGGGGYKFPVVSQMTKGNLGLDKKPAFRYKASDNPVEKAIILLNYCIDDIERFVAEVKACSMELANKYPPDYAFRMKKERYQATQFTSIFQKFKMAFNLLAKLDGELQNPSARELLLHLFPPLALLLDESHELFDVDLVKDISCPMPTKKAVDMMTDCLKDRPEIELWRALGDYWQNPKSAWEGDILPYQPKFQDGWSPGIIEFSDEEDEEDDMDSLESASFYHNSGGGRNGYSRQNSVVEANGRRPALASHSKKDSISSSATLVRQDSYNSTNTSYSRDDMISVGSMSSAVVRNQDDFRDMLMDRGAPMALVTTSWTAQEEPQLTARRGEYLQILDCSKNWWRVRNLVGREGFMPCTFLRKIIYEEPVLQQPPRDNNPENMMHPAVVRTKSSQSTKHSPAAEPVYQQPRNDRNSAESSNGYRTTQDATLTFSSEEDDSDGYSLKLENSPHEDDYEGAGAAAATATAAAVVHHQQTKKKSAAKQPTAPPTPTRKESRLSSSRTTNANGYQQEPVTSSTVTSSAEPVAAPPPPPPPPPMPPSHLVIDHDPLQQLEQQRRRNRQNSSCGSIRSSMSVQDELKSVLEVFREKETVLNIKTTPDVYISKTSSPQEVKQWLKDKNFSRRVQDQLGSFDGNRLLSLKRADLVSAFGSSEGSRLDGQITISKKTTGFGTASSELRQILFKARKRTETAKSAELDLDTTAA